MSRRTLGLLALTMILQLLLGFPFLLIMVIVLYPALPHSGWGEFVAIWAISCIVLWPCFTIVNCHLTHALEDRC